MKYEVYVHNFSTIQKNEYLVMENGKPLYYQLFKASVWEKSKILNSLPTKHLPHDGRHTFTTLVDDAEVKKIFY